MPRSKKPTPSVVVTNPRAAASGFRTTTLTPFAGPAPMEPVRPVATPRSRRLVPGPSVKITGKTPNPYVGD